MGRHMKAYIKNIVMVVLIVTAVLNMHYIPYNGLYISMLDVGQGDCIYVRDVNGVNTFLTEEALILKMLESTGYTGFKGYGS